MNGRAEIISKVAALVLTVCIARLGFSQTAGTGALTGTTADKTHAVIPGVAITLTNEANGEARTVISNENGSYAFPLLVPASYRLEAALKGFKTSVRSGIRVNVTETVRIDILLEVGQLTETVTVNAAPEMVQQDTSALGRVASETVVSNLPLVSRNYTQILGLSPGITTDVTNAGELGRGSGGQMTSRTSVNGSQSTDNNFQIDGVEVNDWHASSAGSSAGTAIPNPDTIQEFKVQTAQADASFGRNSGATVNIITKSGTNEFHGSLFEFFRNEALNANDFFFNRTRQRKPVVRQNQYGVTVGGPIKREKLFFFGSYERTHQINGLAAGRVNATCKASISSPPLTNDRSAATLGTLFRGLRGQNGGVAIQPDGSNINPVALRILNLRRPDGSYLYPTPQVIDPSQPFARQGFSAFSKPCTYYENQFMTNFDYLQTEKSKFAGRFFFADTNQYGTFQSATANVVNGTPTLQHQRFAVVSVAHTYVFSAHVLNEFRAGAYVSHSFRDTGPAFKFSDVGILAPTRQVDVRPTIAITGSYNLSTGSSIDLPQQLYTFQDHFSYVRKAHNFRFGGGISRLKDDLAANEPGGNLSFLSFPDFLLGLSAAGNGSSFSNVFSSSYAPLWRLEFARAWDGFAYVQDDMKVGQRLALNLGLRYERMSHAGSARHINVNFDPAVANPNPPAEGTLAGYLFPSDWRGEVPPGATRFHNDLGINGDGQNNLAPRFGFAWKMLPKSDRLVLRGGYGVYYVKIIGNAYNNNGAQIFAMLSGSGATNATATFQSPFLPLPPNAPTEVNSLVSPGYIQSQRSYSPTTSLTTNGLALDYRPGITQQHSLNVQTGFGNNVLLEIGYVGARGTHLPQTRSINQALLASPSNPIRGVTTNTVANVRQRVPILGIQPTGFSFSESSGSSWYNGLQTSLTKRMSKGLQFLASYTWSKTMGTSTTAGDQYNTKLGYGPSGISRAHRFVISSVYQLPNLANPNGWVRRLAGGWSVSGVATFQTGNPLTILYTNSNNVTGITSDRAQIASGCAHADVVTSGPLRNRLNKYFNTACFTTPPVVGNDGIARTFGNSGTGIVTGPGQYNVDMSITKKFPLGSNENRRLEFRAESFNLLNTPQFNAPDTNFSSSTFGQISSTAVNPRFVQLALKLIF